LDRVTLQLRRQYSKDELVAALVKLLGEKDRMIGELESEVAHLTYELEKELPKKEIEKQSKILARADGRYVAKREQCHYLEKEIQKLKVTRDNAIARAFTLEKKLLEYEKRESTKQV